MSTHEVLAKSLCLATFATALATGATLAPAQADQRPCVSQAEYNHVVTTDPDLNEVRGWRQARVADHFDIPGTRIGFTSYEDEGVVYTDTLWKYRKCSTWGPGGRYVGVWYDNYSWRGDRYMRVFAKSPNRPYELGGEWFW